MPLIVNGVEIENLIVINTATGEQVDIETLQDQLGNILFQKQTAPAWFNYTGIDINGNYEGTSAYDGNPVAYGIGKPNYTTEEDGTIIIGNTWDDCNGLNDDYFIEKYGTNYVKTWSISNGDSVPMQVVQDILVIPDVYNDLPITTIFQNSFFSSAYYISTTGEDKFTQASFYKNIVFGKNITTIDAAAFYGTNVPVVKLPTTITDLGMYICGIIPGTKEHYLVNPVLEINSNVNVVSLENIETVIYAETVTQVNNPLTSFTTYYGFSQPIRVFRQPVELEVTIKTAKLKSAQAMIIYTDNNSIKNYDWSTNGNITPTFYPLSDYVG